MTGEINVCVSRGGGLIECEIVQMFVPCFGNAEKVQVIIGDEFI